MWRWIFFVKSLHYPYNCSKLHASGNIQRKWLQLSLWRTTYSVTSRWSEHQIPICPGLHGSKVTAWLLHNSEGGSIYPLLSSSLKYIHTAAPILLLLIIIYCHNHHCQLKQGMLSFKHHFYCFFYHRIGSVSARSNSISRSTLWDKDAGKEEVEKSDS